LIVIVMAASVIIWRVRDNNRKERIAKTRTQVAGLVEELAGQVMNEDPAARPESGLLDDRDAWDQPLELTVNHSLLGSSIVVRSHGPDQQPATLDDIKDSRFLAASAKEVGGELANRGLEAAREKFNELLPEKQDDEPPDATGAQQDQTDAEQTEGRLEVLGKRIKQLLPGKKADEPADSPELEEN
jgi:hypothetical protein